MDQASVSPLVLWLLFLPQNTLFHFLIDASKLGVVDSPAIKPMMKTGAQIKWLPQRSERKCEQGKPAPKAAAGASLRSCRVSISLSSSLQATGGLPHSPPLPGAAWQLRDSCPVRLAQGFCLTPAITFRLRRTRGRGVTRGIDTAAMVSASW